MVKGINRQVIVVKSPDPKLFEQAIFLLREDALAKTDASPEQIIRQAQRAADSYLRKNTVIGRAAARLSPVSCAVAGAVLASAVWGAGLIFF